MATSTTKSVYPQDIAAKRVANASKTLVLDLRRVDAAKGFKHTVAEGKKLAKRSYTELPEFKDEK
jgi:hypothetical protein